MLDVLFKLTRKLAEGLDDQASAIREHTSSLAEKTLSNAIDFGHKLARLREPQELVELQSEYIARQAQAVAEQSKELGQKIKSGAEKLANVAARTTVRPSQAADGGGTTDRPPQLEAAGDSHHVKEQANRNKTPA